MITRSVLVGKQYSQTTTALCFTNLVSVSRIWLFILAVCFGFSKMWWFDMSSFDPNSGFSFETDSQKN